MRRESGVSLMMVVVAIGLSGILMVVVSNMLNQQRKVMNQIKWQREKEDVRTVVRRSLNCLLAACDDRMKTLPEEVGNWHIRGECDEDGVMVEARRYNRHGKPARHPLTEKPAKWEALYPDTDPYLCPVMNSGYLAPAKEDSGQYVPSEEYRAPRNGSQNQPSPSRSGNAADLMKQLDPQELEELMEKTNEAIKNLCPPGKALVAIDTRSMTPVCE